MSLFKFPDHFPLYICITSFKLIFFVLLASCQFRASKSVNPASLGEPESSLEMSYSHPRGGTTTKETIIVPNFDFGILKGIIGIRSSESNLDFNGKDG